MPRTFTLSPIQGEGQCPRGVAPYSARAKLDLALSLLRSQRVPDVMQPTAHLDAALVAAARRGEARSVAELIERLGCIPAMLRLRERKLGTRLTLDERGDAVQEVLAAVWSKLAVYHGNTPLEAWVYGFVVREHYKTLARRRGAGSVEDPQERPAAAPTSPLDEDGSTILQRSLEELGPPSSDIVRLRHYDELEFSEIGSLLAIPTNTVKTRYYRAIQRLRVLLQPFWREVIG